jgi:hypothetical protein
MKKLTKQQVIILAVMVIAIIYGGYDFLLSKPKKTSVQNPAGNSLELSSFVTEFTAGIAKELPKKIDTYIVSRAEAKWAGNPFSDTKLYTSWKITKEPAVPAVALQKNIFSYTGYMEGGARKIAIINGTEYSIGEALEIPGYSVKEIYPSRVVILNKRDKKTISVPLQE